MLDHSAGRLKVMVLAGGPDRERPVSLMSGAAVTASLLRAGHEVRQRDVLPANLAPLDEFRGWGGDVVFPMLHGPWGEGGPLQRALDERGLPYVGCTAAAAEVCIDKARAKEVLRRNGLPTPASELVSAGQKRSLEPPAVVKAPREGSSIDLVICRNAEQLRRARSRLHRRHPQLLIERYVSGKEITVSIIGAPRADVRLADTATVDAFEVLPPIQIIPATEFYDYAAKYDRDDTQYLFNINLPDAVLSGVREIAVRSAHALGCRHLCRVDLIVDDDHQPWVLEVNTIPGFTSHSLLPKAAAHAGIPLTHLVDRLARLGARREPMQTPRAASA